MNLSEFLENFYSETKIKVISKSDLIFQGYVKDFPKEEASLYWIGSKKATFIEDIIRIVVVHEKDCENIERLKRVVERRKILEAIIFAIENIRDIHDIIFDSKDTRECKEKFCKKFGFDDNQAQCIVDMRLRTLVTKERMKIQKEYDELLDKHKELIKSLSDFCDNENSVKC